MNTWNNSAERDYNLRVFDEELNDFLPGKIFDAHVHIAPPDGFLPCGPFDCAGVPLTSYTYDELAADLKTAFPNRHTSAKNSSSSRPPIDPDVSIATTICPTFSPIMLGI